jgi:predicted nucleotide-binding protein
MSGLTKLSAAEKLLKLADEASNLKPYYYNSSLFKKWRRDTFIALSRIFGENAQHVQEFNEINYEPYGLDDDVVENLFYVDGLNDATVLLQSMAGEILDFWDDTPIDSSKTHVQPKREACVFIGHGRSPIWARLQLFLEKELKLNTVNYESESRAGEAIVAILEKMLEESTFAILIMTAEDETATGIKRARQNVIHEAGLFQGRLGFNKAILLVQDGLEEFSNVAGLQHIPFSGDRIDHTFNEVRRVLKREGLTER